MNEQQARRADVQVFYNGKDISTELSESLISLTYSDNAPGVLDDLQMTVADPERKWQGPWSPSDGDKIDARIKTINWGGPAEFKFLPCGTFEVDSFDISGPPDTATIRAVSLPLNTNVRRERRSRSWEKVSLRTLAQDVATTGGMTLLFETTDNPVFERLDQTDQSDLAFLVDLCTREGIAVKIASGKLVLFDERVYEQKAPALTISRTDVDSYSFGWSVSTAAYRAARLTYKEPDKAAIDVTFTPPGAPSAGPVLRLAEAVSSVAEGLRVAEKRLREKNKEFGRATLTLPGDTRLVSSITITVAGFGRFDGKYIVESATHSIGGNGYTTNIQIRKVLGW